MDKAHELLQKNRKKMTLKLMKSSSIPLKVGQMPIKTTLRYYFLPMKIAKLCEAVAGRSTKGHSDTQLAGMQSKRYNPSAGQFGTIFQHYKSIYPFDQPISFLGIYLNIISRHM